METDKPSASQLFHGMFANYRQLKAAFPVVPGQLTPQFVEDFISNIVKVGLDTFGEFRFVYSRLSAGSFGLEK